MNPEDLAKRAKIVSELRVTEQNYLRDILILKDVFIQPLRAEGLIPDETLDAIFSPSIFDITAISGKREFQ